MEPTVERGEVRIALILGDRRGTVYEIYARWPHGIEARVTGFSQREQVEISASFVHALERFASRHPELALASPTPVPTCPGEAQALIAAAPSDPHASIISKPPNVVEARAIEWLGKDE